MKYFAPILLLLSIQATPVNRETGELHITKKQLMNKIMGGWAGQVIGITLEGQTFPLNDSLTEGHQTTTWHDNHVKPMFEKRPELYNDLYMDLSFVEVIETEGMKAPVKSLAKVFSGAGYMLQHANQIARYNILHGIDPPASGHWLHNPHADDIDFMIAADFAGLTSPGMPVTASQICEKVGHIMTYGDGYYGGLYVANLYSLAFTTNNIEYIVREAIKSIPIRSMFHNCIADVIRWYGESPHDWKHTGFALQKKWSDNIGCPGGSEGDAKIDAKLNAGYITLALLYGKGDFTKTIEILTSTEQRADCSLSSTAGILGTMLGYDNIPDYWMKGLKDIEDTPFKYTTMSLQDAYSANFRSALKIIEQNDGKVRQENIIIRLQKPVVARYEKSFSGHYVREKRSMKNTIITDQLEFEFEGIGFVLRGETSPWDNTSDHIIFAELYLNNKFVEKAALPTNFTTGRSELFWKFQLPHNKYRVKVKILNPSDQYYVSVTDVVVYDVNNY